MLFRQVPLLLRSSAEANASWQRACRLSSRLFSCPGLGACSSPVPRSPQRWPGAPRGALTGVHVPMGETRSSGCWRRSSSAGLCGLPWGCAPPSVSSLLSHRPIQSGSSAPSSHLHQRGAGRSRSVPSPMAPPASSVHGLAVLKYKQQHLSPALKSEFPRQHWGTCNVFQSSRMHRNNGFSWVRWNTAPLQGRARPMCA